MNSMKSCFSSSSFELVGESPHFKKSGHELLFASHGTVQTRFECVSDGRCHLVVKGRSSPAKRVFGIARIAIDGQAVGEVEVKSKAVADHPLDGSFLLGKGEHILTVEFTNDLYEDGEDRNLYVRAVGLSAGR